MWFPVALVLFVGIPLAEFRLLWWIGHEIGFTPTVILVVATGVVGSWLAKMQGYAVLASVQRDLHEGRMPTDTLLSGVLVLVGAVLLVTPGVMTDVVGLLLMVPGNRRLAIRGLKRYFRTRIQFHPFPQSGFDPGTGMGFGTGFPPPGTPSDGMVKDVDARTIDEEKDPA